MTDPLRTLARTRWRQDNEALRRREGMRRMWSLFFLALAVTMCGLLTVKIAAQHIAGPTAQQIEKGLGQ